MKTRITNKNYAKFKNYGGREIKCDEFNYFVDFYDLMYDSYLEHLPSFCEEHNIVYGNIIAAFSRDKSKNKVKLRTKWSFEVV